MQSDRASNLVIVDDHCDSASFAIEGLCFEPNLQQPLDPDGGWFDHKILSSEGPLISDFVTHEVGFAYGTYGIHLGQDDRLTFFAPGEQTVVGHFVDCRADSPTRRARVSIRYAASGRRRLVVPRGVAHTFDNLDRIVTRDEPIWYADDDNVAWNIDNDLISFGRSTPDADLPLVRANRFRIPREAHLFLSRLSQTVLAQPKPYRGRTQVRVGGQVEYLLIDPVDWADEHEEIERMLRTMTTAGVAVRKNRYALTGGRSWTLVPNTASCVADLLSLPPTSGGDFFCHARTHKIYTFLDEGPTIELELFDARTGSPTEGATERLALRCDPRLHLVIPHGVAYRFHATERLRVRCEHEVFVDRDEPRTDIPAFGSDLIRKRPDALAAFRIAVPTLRCPPGVVYEMARLETSGLSRTEPAQPLAAAVR